MDGATNKARWTSQALAELAFSLAANPPTGSESLLRQCLIDVSAAAVAARNAPARAMARRFATVTLGTGDAALWFEPGATSSVLGAAFVNATAAAALDIDDGNRAARGHLGAAVIPAATALGAAHASSAERFAAALLKGFEIGARLGAAEDPGHSASGRWAGAGVAAAAGVLLELDATRMAHAIALAVHTAPMMAHASRRMAMFGHVKEGIPFATLSGLNAALLAQEGFLGDLDAVESTGAFDLDTLAAQSVDTLLFHRTYFKIYACCRLSHAPIDAVLHLIAAHDVAPDRIAEMRIDLFRTAIDLPNETDPATFEGAQYSVPFTVALAALRGPKALLPMTEAQLADAEVQALAQRVHLRHEPDFDPLYPGGTPCRVRITLTDGRTFSHEVATARGDPALPLDTETLIDKFTHLAGVEMPEAFRVGQALAGALPSARAYQALLAGPWAGHGPDM